MSHSDSDSPCPPALSPGRSPAWAYLLIAGVGVLVYLNSLPNGFAYDDIVIIRDNPTVHDLSNQARIWLTPYWPGPEAWVRGLYRPLTTFLFAVQWWLGGGSPLPFHVFSLVLHVAASVLVYRLVLDLTHHLEGSLLAATVFAVHPVHVEAVANAVGQAELVTAVLILIALRIHDPGDSGGVRPWGRSVAVGTCFLLALLAKEHAIVLPLLLFIWDLARSRVGRPDYVSMMGRRLILLAGIAGVYLAARWIVMGGSLTGDAAAFLPFLRDPVTRLGTALAVWPEYARLLVFPVDLSGFYDPGTLPVWPGAPVRTLSGMVLLAGLAMASLHPGVWPGLRLGSAWLLITILPVSNLVFPIGTLLAERTLYLPSVAVAIWLATLLPRVSHRAAPRRRIGTIVRVTLGMAVIALGMRTMDRNPIWRDNETLFSRSLEEQPRSFRLNWFDAIRLTQAGDTARARLQWQRTMGIYSGDPSFLAQYADFLLGQGRSGQAHDLAEAALEVYPDLPLAVDVSARVRLAQGDTAGAVERGRRLQALGYRTLVENLVAAGVPLNPGGR